MSRQEEEDVWSLDHAFGKWIVPRLEIMITTNIGWPAELEDIDEWHVILTEMLEGFRIVGSEEYFLSSPDDTETHAKIEKSLELFKKWFNALWT